MLNEFKKYCESAAQEMEFILKANESLREENKRLKEERYEDNELARMKNELEEAYASLRRGFPISEFEKQRLEAWTKQHTLTHIPNPSKHKYGVSYLYEFRPTEIGTFGTVKCGICGAEYDFQKGV